MKRVLSIAAAAFLLVSVPPAFADEQPDEQPDEQQEELSPPQLLHEEEADYTEEAIEAGVEGGVILELELDDEGDVIDVTVIDGLGYGLDESAVEAAEQFEFQPAKVDGEPIPVIIDFEVRFSMPTLPASVTGWIVDADDEVPLEGARVHIRYVGDEYDPPPEATTTTDEEGEFYFADVPPGDYVIEAQLDTHRDFDTELTLNDGDELEVEYAVLGRDENVVGEIREAGTRDRLAGMEVVLVDADTDEIVREDYSGEEGRFSFQGIDPGDYLLVVRGSGYDSAEFELDVIDDEVTTGEFYIRAEHYDDMTVRTVERRERAEVDRQTIGIEETRRMAGAGTDAVRVVENLPGVARQNYAQGQPVVRGAAPEDTAIFLEGDSIPLAFHFLGGPAVVNTEMIDSVDFYPGNFSARFGRATAGIIDMQTRSPQDDRIHGFVEADLLDSSAIVEGPISDRWSFALSGRRSYYDVFLPSIMDFGDFDTFVFPRYYDYQSWTTYRSEEGDHKVEFFLYGSDDRFEMVFPDDEPQGDATVQVTGANFANYFHRGQVRWEYDDEDSPFRSELMASLGRNTVGFELADDLFFNLDYTTSQVRWDTGLELTDDLELRSGVDSQIGPVSYGFGIPELVADADDSGIDLSETEDERTTWQVDPAVYTELDYELFDRWRLIPGLRVDYFGSVNETSISPRFATRFGITDEVVAKGGVGLFTQPPLPGQTEEGFGNPDLSFEQAIHYAVGAEWQPDDHLELDTTLFFRDNRDLVVGSSAEEMDDAGERTAELFNNDGQGRAYGWELLLRHYPHNNFFGWVSYTLSRSERRDPSTGDWELFDSDQTHILTLVGGYELPWDLDLSARFRLVTGNPQTPVVGAVFDADDDSYRSRRGERNSVRAGTFHQLDLRLDRQFIFDTWRMSAYLDISNVYNAANEEGTQYNYDYTESEPLRGVPFLPTIGVSARF